jgi:hypothetical protein
VLLRYPSLIVVVCSPARTVRDIRWWKDDSPWPDTKLHVPPTRSEWESFLLVFDYFLLFIVIAFLVFQWRCSGERPVGGLVCVLTNQLGDKGVELEETCSGRVKRE